MKPISAFVKVESVGTALPVDRSDATSYVVTLAPAPPYELTTKSGELPSVVNWSRLTVAISDPATVASLQKDRIFRMDLTAID